MLKKSICVLMCLSFLLSLCSCLGENYDTDFSITGEALMNYKQEKMTEKTEVTIDGFTEEFNYYGIKYISDSYLKCTITYVASKEDVTEEFFLEPSEKENEFYSFIDNALEKTTGKSILNLSFEPLNTKEASFEIIGVSAFLKEVPKQEVFIETENYKIGVDLLWGGALSYLEDLNSNVEAVEVQDKIKVDSNASERYDTKAVSKNVNLINRNDTGRLVQQSYYGTNEAPYEPEKYMDNVWSYNPVQGGNQYNENSKIVDINCTDTEIYVKCRPLDWAKSKEFITPSYMEAWYTIENNNVHVKCRFVDFSGYPEAKREQELPAFYCIEPLNTFMYFDGVEPFSKENKLITNNKLGFWPDEGYPKFTSVEHWAGYRGEFSDSFGIGVYMPTHDTFLTGVFMRGETTEKDPSRDGPTSYIAVVKENQFRSFEPKEYNYYISTGSTDEIRNNFKEISELV